MRLAAVIRFLYTLVLSLVSPVLIFLLIKKSNGSNDIGSRWKEMFGFSPPAKGKFLAKTFWIHSVSVGETIAVIPFVRELHDSCPGARFIITTTTATGAEQAKKIRDIASHRYMPFDLPFSVKNFIRIHQPNRLIIMEKELWPNTLHVANKCGLAIYIINARFSERSKRSYKNFLWLLKPLCLSKLTHVFCQSQADMENFQEAGVERQKISITGSIKNDIQIPLSLKEKTRRLRVKIGEERQVWVAASTHEGEEEKLLDVHREILVDFPEALLIIVPRHPERFNRVDQVILDSGFSSDRRSKESSSMNEKIHHKQVYLADTMGEMLLLMGVSDVCFIGGSLIGNKAGGHNVLEPAALGIPTIIGPSYFNFQSITNGLARHDALIVTPPKKGIIVNHLRLLFSSEERRCTMASNAKNFVRKNTGAIAKTVKKLK